MNRFQDRKRHIPRPGGLLLSAALTAGVFALFLGAVFETGKDVEEKERENLKQVLDRSAVICYSLEGSYPESLSYLKEHYGIQWDESQYLVDFEVVGSNLPPDITVIAKKSR